MKSGTEGRAWRRVWGWALLGLGGSVLLVLLLLLRLTVANDYLYHALVKDPERHAPEGPVIVAPADGTVLYVKRITDGVIPEVIKQGVRVPVVEHAKTDAGVQFGDGWLVGIYMNTYGVHINRMPNHGVIKQQIIFNGPHMDMTTAETRIILTEMIPGLVSLRRLFGLTPHGTEHDHDFVLQSARETLIVEDERGVELYIVRIADYYVGKILTWVDEEQSVERGERIGMISWGSQTDLFIQDTPGLSIEARVGDYVYGGESVLATY